MQQPLSLVFRTESETELKVSLSTLYFSMGHLLLLSIFLTGGFILVSDYVRMEVTLVHL